MADTHLAANTALTARGINMSAHFDAMLQDLLGLPHRPAGMFVVGDCAFNSGETADYAVLAAALKPLRTAGIPIHLALGNHDNRERFWEALESERAVKRPVADRQTALVRSRRANWFVLDSLEKTLSTPGLLGESQLNWLAAALDRNVDRPAVVLAHHNPGTVEGIGGLKDTAALLDVLRPRRQVKAFVYGHTHRWGIDPDPSGLHVVNLPPVAYVFREGDPSGWVHASLGEHGMLLELRCVDRSHPLHGDIRQLVWR
jgi:3',5'-cyclic AMP phosphodiesterase CpdA